MLVKRPYYSIDEDQIIDLGATIDLPLSLDDLDSPLLLLLEKEE